MFLSFAIGSSFMVAAEQDANEPPPPPTAEANDQNSNTQDKVVWKPAVEPKSLSNEVQKGLDWLVGHQLESGAWGQGEESAHMRGSSRVMLDGAAKKVPDVTPVKGMPLKSVPEKIEKSARIRPTQMSQTNNAEKVNTAEIPSVADTCMAALALIRSGSTPSKGPYAENVLKAINFICSQVEEADEKSLFITQTRGTRVQSKLGPYIDTFMAAMLLPEVLKQMPDDAGNKRVKTALEKVLKKMELNQREDGTWSDQGWASALAQGAATKGINRSMQSGANVSSKMQRKAEQYAQQSYDKSSGKFRGKGSAGVELYASSSNLSAMADSVNSNNERLKDAKENLEKATSDEERQELGQKVKRFEKAITDLEAQQEAVVKKLDDKRFIAGFGNNGGEEFLSYMNIGESLVVKGGDEWKKWDEKITKNLNNVQNKDGSWSGHHCITGRTFCTSAALLVLMVDRAPFPVSDKVKRQR
jgi:hypothetical protein